MSTPRARVALYSPGMVGLGHVRRNLLIAQALVASGLQPAVLLIAEAAEAAAFHLPPGVDCVTLPALRKTGDDRFRPRRIALAVERLVELRARVIHGALTSFCPDVLIVDHLPRGAARELDPVLEDLCRGGTRCVLGLRDVLEAPATVRREWAKAESFAAVDRWYHSIWVYGDPAVYDLAAECQFPPQMGRKVRYTGYLDQRPRLAMARADHPILDGATARQRLFLCAVGGGQDGGRLAQTFARADFPPDAVGVILSGPFMPGAVGEQIRAALRNRPQLHVLGFVSEPTPLVARADRIIAMGGYNTLCELLSFGKRALIVPRAGPRREQLIRAERFHALGLVEMVHPQDLSPDVLSDWFRQDPAPGPPARRVDLHGLDRIVGMIQEMLALTRRRTMRVRQPAAISGAGL